ncbi:MAG: peptide ABC transporter substrate-binding protein [Tissierella sp.]|nr:peptide ABC transporter substrate-binding protein [Tissierella sp.]
MIWKKNLIAIFMAIILLLTGCGPANVIDTVYENDDDSTLDLSPTEGGQVIIPLTNFSTLNPLLTTNSHYHYFSKLIFEGLFDFNQDLSIEPKLAESYFIFNEGKTISIKLKNDIQWHDGNSFTSEDVQFTIDVIKYANRESTYGNILESSLGADGVINFNTVINTKVIDDNNIEITFDKQYLNNLEVLTFPIIPKHIFVQNGNKNPIINALVTDDYLPIGTGPYKFVSHEKHKFVTLNKNENYWNGTPYINEIVGRVLDDEELILTAFETGQINFASTIGVDWDKYRQNSRIKVLEYISPNYEFIGFNFNNGLMQDEKGQSIRKAIAYGINRQDIIHKVYLGHGTQIDVPMYPDSYLLSSGANTFGYNKDIALEILNKAGFKDIDEDGILEDENGVDLSLRLVTNVNNSTRRLVADLIKDNLRDIGIEVKLDFNTQYTKEYDEAESETIWEEFNSKISKGDYDMVLLGWQSSIIPNLYPMYHSSMISKGTNFINYNNESMDLLLRDTLIDNPIESKVD